MLAILTLLLLCLISIQTGYAAQEPEIEFVSFGEGSVVTSPINLAAEVQPETMGMIRVEVIDRKGFSLARKLMPMEESIRMDIPNFVTQIPFEIPDEASEALLTLAKLDEFGRPVVLRSVIVTLQSSGEENLNSYQPQAPWIILENPKGLRTYSGGKIQVKGTLIPLSEKPIRFELMTKDKRLVGSSQIPVTQVGVPLVFDLNLYYSFINSLTNTRLSVSQAADPYGADAMLDSLNIYLLP